MDNRDVLCKIARANLDQLWEHPSAMGIWVRKEDLPELHEYIAAGDFSWFTQLFDDPERLAELESGAAPAEDEIAAFNEKWIEEALEMRATRT